MTSSARRRGFTLIELVIALAIVAVLVSIALPSYRKQVQKGNRGTGKAALTQVLAREEAFFSDRKSYATTLTALGYSADTMRVCSDGSFQSTCPSNSGIYSITVCTSGSYTSSTGASITCAAATANKVWLQATPINAQNSPAEICGVLVAATDGTRGQATSSTMGTDCWQR